MFMYSAYMALVVTFVLVIVLHAWFVRRIARLRDQARALREDCERTRQELAELTQVVSELDHGKDSNAVSIVALDREIQDVRARIRAFLSEHPELQGEYGEISAGTGSPAGGAPSPAGTEVAGAGEGQASSAP
ncbi:MAG: hypothetical protein AB1505_20210 [Candidatus Latescibacterota bacterium]